jgi:hypothetical protein
VASKHKAATRRPADPPDEPLDVVVQQDDHAAPGDLVVALAVLVLERARRATGGSEERKVKRGSAQGQAQRQSP